VHSRGLIYRVLLPDFLRSPETYRSLGLQGEVVQTIETHHAWVFLFGEHALKLKKPVRSRWLDFSTPALRGAACRAEWRLNQALAPGVYLGLVQVRAQAGGWVLRLEAGAQPLAPGLETPTAHGACSDATVQDWLVLMRRLPAERMLDQLIADGTLGPEAVDRLARALCGFWSSAQRVAVDPGAWCERAAQALHEHARGLEHPAWVLPKVNAAPWRAAALQAQQALAGCRRLLDGCARDLAQRAAQGRIVNGHGDLRPEHVHLPPAPGRPLVIDRLEFNEGLRQVDPFEELSYLAVECRRLDAAWVGRRLFAQCGRLLDDRPPHRLLRLYGAQRALLRARLCLAHLQEASVQDGQRWRDQAAWYVACACLATGVQHPGCGFPLWRGR
jgi:aminoglycoside phosphotransferase family enzyme